VIIAVTNPYTIQSFYVVLYDVDQQEVASYQVPISVAAPFANRLFRELLPGETMREPWYSLAPYTVADEPLKRAPYPVGPTSLFSAPYDPATQTAPTLQMHPLARVRYFVVRLYDVQELKYEGAYSVDDIFLHGAHYLLHHRVEKGELPPDRGPYHYAIVPSREPVHKIPADLLPDEMYAIEGIFALPVRADDEPRIAFRKIIEPPFPEQGLAQPDQAVLYGQGEPQKGQVIIPQPIYDLWREHLELSQENEEGGYIVGRVYRQPGSPPQESDEEFRWIVEISDIFAAEGAIGTPVSLLFTHDTWSRGRIRRARDFPGRELVGWWHTHPFPASDAFGLSGWDQEKHARFFTRPYQVAILLNIEAEEPRTVRCYQRDSNGLLVETPYLVMPSENKPPPPDNVNHDYPVPPS
jgi:hypothetical protein